MKQHLDHMNKTNTEHQDSLDEMQTKHKTNQDVCLTSNEVMALCMFANVHETRPRLIFYSLKKMRFVNNLLWEMCRIPTATWALMSDKEDGMFHFLFPNGQSHNWFSSHFLSQLHCIVRQSKGS